MFRIGITGGIGSGKSYVAALLAGEGIPVYDTDREARRLMVESADIRAGLCALLGEKAFCRDGSLNRPAIAAYLFAAPSHAEQVNRIVHPVVKEDFCRWVAQKSVPLVAMECAILYESGFDRLVDRVLLVHAPAEVRLARAMRRDGATEAQVKARMALQLADEELCGRADHVLENGLHGISAPDWEQLVRWIRREAGLGD